MNYESCTCNIRKVYVINQIVICANCSTRKGLLINSKPRCVCSKSKQFNVEICGRGEIICKKCGTQIGQLYDKKIQHMVGDLVSHVERTAGTNIDLSYHPSKKKKFNNLCLDIWEKTIKYCKIIGVISSTIIGLVTIIKILNTS